MRYSVAPRRMAAASPAHRAAALPASALAPRVPPPGAAPAHLFTGAAPSSSVILYGPEVLRAALHNALARAELADAQLCVERGAQPGGSHTRGRCA
jgi:hypothetical protein